VIPPACWPDNFVPNLIPNSAATHIRIPDHRDGEIKLEIKFGIKGASIHNIYNCYLLRGRMV
jgi:hypothetical protein